MNAVVIQHDDFLVDDCQRQLVQASSSIPGAIVSFTGLVRDYAVVDDVKTNVVAIELEHYEGMTENLIETIIEQAKQRWSITASLVIHRVGYLKASEQIVYVGVASAHRGNAFKACEFIMDYLKTDATLWKKEFYAEGEYQWLGSKLSDSDAAKKWL